MASPALAVTVNDGSDRPFEVTDSVIADDGLGGGPRMLYMPTEADDPAFRADIAAAMGGTCDYYDSRGAVPSLDFLMEYDCVHIWINFAPPDADGLGDVLARFVDAGGAVELGAFCTFTSGFALGGDIMTEAYCPVVGGDNWRFFDTYRGDGSSCITDNAAGAGGTYLDIISIWGAGVEDGTFNDGETFVAHNAGFTPNVTYVNGSGGFPIDGNNAGMVGAVADACTCTGGSVPVEETTWGSIKGTF